MSCTVTATNIVDDDLIAAHERHPHYRRADRTQLNETSTNIPMHQRKMQTAVTPSPMIRAASSSFPLGRPLRSATLALSVTLLALATAAAAAAANGSDSTTIMPLFSENMSLVYEDEERDPQNFSVGSSPPTYGGGPVTLTVPAASPSPAVSTTPQPGEWSHFYDLMLSWQGICLIAVFCTFIVITIIGNTLVILAVITTRRLKTVTNCFVMSLAVADLLVGIFVMPPAVAVHLIGSWQLGWVLCDIWISLDVLLCTASILSLCAISVDRYLAVTQPLTYSRKRRSKRLALIMILIVWVLALAITCPPMLGWYEPGRRDLKECRYNQNEGYVIFSAMGSFFIPMAVMIYVYARISCVIASRHDNMTDISVHNNKKFKRYTSADVENDIEPDVSEQDLSAGQKKQAAARTLSNQAMAKELHEAMLSDSVESGRGGSAGDAGSSSRSHCHSLLTLTATNSKNGCYELTRPTSMKRSPTPSSTMTTVVSGGVGVGGVGGVGRAGSDSGSSNEQWSFGGGGGGGGVQQSSLTRPHSVRYHHHHHQQQQQHHLSAPPGPGGILLTSPSHHHHQQMPPDSTLLRQTRVHHHHGHNHHHHHTTKSLSNRITSLKKENKTTQTLSIVVGGFIACWLPFFIYYLITPFLAEDQVSRTLAKVLTWLGWFNSAINPFIYAFYSVDFRAAFWRLTCKRFFSSSMKPQFPSNTMSIRR